MVASIDTNVAPRPARGLTGARLDAAILRIAAPQHGIVTREQLLEAGASPHALARRVTAGLLVRVHQGVYRVGPVVSPLADEVAASLACGGRSAVSHESAGYVWWGRAGVEKPMPVRVSLTGGVRRRPGIRIHRHPTLRADEITRVQGLAITTPARTLLDLAGVVSSRELERAVAEAMARRLVSRKIILALLKRHRGWPGARALSELVSAERDPARTRSEAEDLFANLVRRGGLPEPGYNVRIEGQEVDAVWRKARLIVEIDGVAFHSSPAAFERDRKRDRALAAAGWRVMRVTWRQLTESPEALLVELVRALERGGAADSPGRR